MRSLLLVAIVVTLVAATRPASAGPYCGTVPQLAPASGSKLPRAPTVGLFIEDSYYGGDRTAKAAPLAVRAKIGGASVPVTTKKVRGVDGIIVFVKIGSRRTGTLQLSAPNKYTRGIEVIAEYTIVDDWTAPETVTATVLRARDTRLGPYRYIGEQLALRLDHPAIAFSLRWRRDEHDAWRVHPLPASVDYDSKQTEALLGETMCGMVTNVPLAFLEAGIEAELTAWLPDGREVKVVVPKPVVLPPLTDEEKARRSDER